MSLYCGSGRRYGPPQFDAVSALDPQVGMALDARLTDVYTDCCESGRLEPLECGALRYTELLGECLYCGSHRFAWVGAGFIGPTRRGDAPCEPPPFSFLLPKREPVPYPEPGDPESIAAFDQWLWEQHGGPEWVAALLRAQLYRNPPPRPQPAPTAHVLSSPGCVCSDRALLKKYPWLARPASEETS